MILTSSHVWWRCVLYRTCLADPLQMSHACLRFLKCCRTLTFGSLSWRCRIHCACHEKLRSNVQKCPKHGVFLAFWLRNVLAAAACTFWMLIPPDGSAPPRFSVLTFSTLRNRKTLEKHSVSRLSTSLAHLSLLSTFLFSDSTLYCCCICL